jgi:hypothetical protein
VYFGPFVDAAPILCAGVTLYKGLKETKARPGEWVVISGAGGLGHVAIQYAKAMGMHVAAVDLGPGKMALARKLGAEITIDAKTQDPVKEIQKQIGGARGVLVTAVSTIAFKQAIGMMRRGGTCVLNGLPPGEFPVSIFDLVLNGQTVRGSIVGTRLDLEESLAFAADGKVKATIETLPLGSINDVFDRMKQGKINGRVVLDIACRTAASSPVRIPTLGALAWLTPPCLLEESALPNLPLGRRTQAAAANPNALGFLGVYFISRTSDTCLQAKPAESEPRERRPFRPEPSKPVNHVLPLTLTIQSGGQIV